MGREEMIVNNMTTKEELMSAVSFLKNVCG